MARGRVSGVALVLAGSAGFGSTAVLIKLLYRAGAGVGTALVVRYGIAALVSMTAVALLRRSLPPRRRLLGWSLVALANGLAAVAFWSAVEFGRVAEVTPIVYLYPALVVVAAALAVREPPRARTFLAVAAGVAGAVLVAGAGFHAPHSALAAGLALASAVGTALFYLAASRAIGEDEALFANATIFAVGALVATPLLVLHGFQPPRGQGWIFLGLLVLTGTIIPFSFLLAGVARIGAVHAAILSVCEPVIAVGLALAVLDDHLSAVQAVGVALVLASFVVAHTAFVRARPLPPP